MLEFDTGRHVVLDSPVKPQAAVPVQKPVTVSDREVKPETEVPKTEKANVQELEAFADFLTDVARSFDRGLRFKVVGEQHRTVVQVIDTQSNEVVREIPSEEALAVKDKIAEAIGLIFDKTGE